jgi:putative nucleotidyltransferase with HDIG domain
MRPDARLEPAQLAESMLAPLGDRWRHVQAVAARAASVTAAVREDDRAVLVDAAWLHDIGYAEAARVTGFHPLNGARHLEARGFDRRLCRLVAHHSGARFEAEERGLADELAAFDLEEGPAMDALIYVDMRTGPRGQPLTFEERISDILDRYAPDHPVHRAISRARPMLAAAVTRVEQRLHQSMWGARPDRQSSI